MYCGNRSSSKELGSTTRGKLERYSGRICAVAEASFRRVNAHALCDLPEFLYLERKVLLRGDASK